MNVVIHLDRRIDPHDHADVLRGAVLAANAQRYLLSRTKTAADAGDVEGLAAVEAEGLSVDSFLELQREDAHADEVRAVDALETLRNHGADAEELRALGGPVAGRAGAV